MQKYVFGTNIESIRIAQPNQSGDGLHTVSGLITFNVRLRENNGTVIKVTIFILIIYLIKK